MNRMIYLRLSRHYAALGMPALAAWYAAKA